MWKIVERSTKSQRLWLCVCIYIYIYTKREREREREREQSYVAVYVTSQVVSILIFKILLLTTLDFFCHPVLNIVEVFYTSRLRLSVVGRRVESSSLSLRDLLRASLCTRKDTPKKRQQAMDMCIYIWVIAEKLVRIACQ